HSGAHDDDIFHLFGVNILSSGYDHVLDAVHNKEVAVLIDPFYVPGSIPLVFERFSRCVIIFEVTFLHTVGLETNFADIARTGLFAVSLHDDHVRTWQGLVADRTGFKYLFVRKEDRAGGACFGHTVDLIEVIGSVGFHNHSGCVGSHGTTTVDPAA